MKSKVIMAIALCALVTLMFSFSEGIVLPTLYPYEDLPMMDVWFENNGNYTFINFHNLKPDEKYLVTLKDSEGTVKSGPHYWSDSSMPFDDFSVPIEPGDIIVLEYETLDMLTETLITYTVSNIGVTEVNVKTNVITGYATEGDPIGVTVFVENPENPENPISYKRVCSAVEGVWTADFSVDGPPLSDGSLNDALDLDTFSTGIIVQTNADWNSTVTNWWAPNPEFMVNPVLDTVSGFGWLGEVTVVFNYGTPEAVTRTIEPDTETGSFENVSFGVDIYAGQSIYIYDNMIEHYMTVSHIAIKSMGIFSDQVILTDAPGAYVQIFVLKGIVPDITIEGIADGNTNTEGELIIDFSAEGGNPCDLQSDSWGFVRNYDGLNNATLYEWRASDLSTVYGDLNGDWVLDKQDLKLLTNIVSGKVIGTPEQLLEADVNSDGMVDDMDIKVLKTLLKTK